MFAAFLQTLDSLSPCMIRIALPLSVPPSLSISPSLFPVQNRLTVHCGTHQALAWRRSPRPWSKLDRTSLMMSVMKTASCTMYVCTCFCRRDPLIHTLSFNMPDHVDASCPSLHATFLSLSSRLTLSLPTSLPPHRVLHNLCDALPHCFFRKAAARRAAAAY